MKSESKIRQIIKSNLGRHPLSTLEDHLDVVKSDYFENVYEIDFYFDAKKNYLDYYESKKGYVELHYDYAANELYICSIDIYKGYQGHGYGGEFVRSLENVAVQLGACKVVAKSSRNDSFWDHMGYVRLSEEHMPDYEREIFF